jgi:hypothetical protein
MVAMVGCSACPPDIGAVCAGSGPNQQRPLGEAVTSGARISCSESGLGLGAARARAGRGARSAVPVLWRSASAGPNLCRPARKPMGTPCRAAPAQAWWQGPTRSSGSARALSNAAAAPDWPMPRLWLTARAGHGGRPATGWRVGGRGGAALEHRTRLRVAAGGAAVVAWRCGHGSRLCSSGGSA